MTTYDTSNFLHKYKFKTLPYPIMDRTSERLISEINRTCEFICINTFRGTGICIDVFDQEPQDLLGWLPAEDLKRLSSDNRVYLLFDNSLEADFSRFTKRFYDHWYYSLKLHGIDPGRTLLLSANLNEHKNHAQWIFLNPQSQVINVYSNQTWLYNSLNVYGTEKFGLAGSYSTKKHYLCLNRRIFDSFSRQLAVYYLHYYGLQNNGYISNQPISDPLVEFDDYRKDLWRNSLGRGRDLDVTLKGSNAGDLANLQPTALYSRTSFSVVTETLSNVESHNRHFYTEKTFRPILYGHPFVIIGEQNQNQNLRRMKLEPYTELYKPKHDCEPNLTQRVKTTIANLQRIIETTEPAEILRITQQKREYNFHELQKNHINVRTLMKIYDRFVA